jgi:hypothetical protein
MLKADDMSAIKIAWRKWITQRVKIIDEYNRIPTKTQSALLSLMAEGYAEMFDQYVYAGRSSWFLTANDDAGGGTFQVIEALKDRIDVVRPCPSTRASSNPAAAVSRPTRAPRSWRRPNVFTPRARRISPPSSRWRSGRGPGSDRLLLGQPTSPHGLAVAEAKSKDTLKLAGQTVSQACNEQCPLDKKVHLCT